MSQRVACPIQSATERPGSCFASWCLLACLLLLSAVGAGRSDVPQGVVKFSSFQIQIVGRLALALFQGGERFERFRSPGLPFASQWRRERRPTKVPCSRRFCQGKAPAPAQWTSALHQLLPFGQNCGAGHRAVSASDLSALARNGSTILATDPNCRVALVISFLSPCTDTTSPSVFSLSVLVVVDPTGQVIVTRLRTTLAEIVYDLCSLF